ncbi:MAG TPA: hypothetical protein VIH18_03325 [Candidatus Binatia bacterium]|jgi:hypothetical protein
MKEGKLVVIAERKFSEFFKKTKRFEASDALYYEDGLRKSPINDDFLWSIPEHPLDFSFRGDSEETSGIFG